MDLYAIGSCQKPVQDFIGWVIANNLVGDLLQEFEI